MKVLLYNMNCRFCKTPLEHVFLDLVNAPASNSFLTTEQLNEPENFYPLKVYVCENCFLVQVDEYKKSDAIFNSGYVYFSSFSTSWLEHSKAYVEKMVNRFELNKNSLVVELASNDGYLLQYFKEKNIPCLGIEPTANTAEAAIAKGIETVIDFFGVSLADNLREERGQADLLLGNNVLAHVPDIIDFVKGMSLILKKEGIITMEFPHLLQLVRNTQFDTIYHEHFSYLSLYAVKQIVESQGLELFDVEEIPTHGGSLRIYAKHKDNNGLTISPAVNQLLQNEIAEGIDSLDFYSHFRENVNKVKLSFLEFLISQKKQKKKIIAYGAAAKGNTMLNYCGVKDDFIDFVVDSNPAKQNLFLPGSHIPVYSIDAIAKYQPDFIIILPWNIKDEIISLLSFVKDWNCQFVTVIPELKII